MALPGALDRPPRLPLIGAPMFLISGPALVIAQCKAGVIGAFPSLNARSTEILDQWLTEIETALAGDQDAAPHAVNLIVHTHNARLEEDLALCVRHKVPLVITSLGARPDVNDAIHAYGGVVLHDVIHDRFARKAIEKGADGLIAVAAGAGGHAGTLSPFALVEEIRAWFDGPLALSGAIATGRAVLAAQALGADFAYIGSAFIASQEAQAAPEYKAAIIAGGASDIIYTNLITGVHGNYLRASLVAAGLDPDNLAEADPSKMDFAGGKAKAWRDIWGSGQGIGAIREILPAATLIDRLANEYEEAARSIGVPI